MNPGIFLIQNNEELVEINEQPYDSEKLLQSWLRSIRRSWWKLGRRPRSQDDGCSSNRNRPRRGFESFCLGLVRRRSFQNSRSAGGWCSCLSVVILRAAVFLRLGAKSKGLAADYWASLHCDQSGCRIDIQGDCSFNAAVPWRRLS